MERTTPRQKDISRLLREHKQTLKDKIKVTKCKRWSKKRVLS